MTQPDELPAGLALVRTTPVFDEQSVPAGLRRAHHIAEGVWGRLVVSAGSLDFVVEGDHAEVLRVSAGGAKVIPPGVAHHVEFDGPVRFQIEFHR